jgi:hypothetical protein
MWVCYAIFMPIYFKKDYKRIVLILAIAIIICGIAFFAELKFNDKSTAPQEEAAAIPAGWYTHKQNASTASPTLLDYTILTKDKELPPPNDTDGPFSNHEIDINIMTTTSSPEEYVVQEGLAGPSTAMLGIQGSWGTFFSYKTFTLGADMEGPINIVMLFNGDKVETFDYRNSEDAVDFWKVITYYAQHPSYY